MGEVSLAYPHSTHTHLNWRSITELNVEGKILNSREKCQ